MPNILREVSLEYAFQTTQVLQLGKVAFLW